MFTYKITTKILCPMPFVDPFELKTLKEAFQRPLFYTLFIALTSIGLLSMPLTTTLVGLYVLFCLYISLLTVIDIKHMILPDILTLSGAGLGLILLPVLQPQTPWFEPLLGALCGSGLFFMVHWGFYKLRGYHGLGLGDVKLMALLGAWVGAFNIPLILLISCFIAFPAFLIRAWLVGTKTSAPLPFGPFLALGAWVSLLYWPYLWQAIFNLRHNILAVF
jgi:prepilin signal peptidase PulO-like enzyme (type II secretory pathway)